MKLRTELLIGLVSVLILGASQEARSDLFGMKDGPADLQSVGPIAFGPEGTLLVADPKAAAVFAFETKDTKPSGEDKLAVADIGKLVAKAVGADQAAIVDLAVNPASGNVYLSVGQGSDAAIVKVDSSGVHTVDIAKLRFAKAVLPNAPEDKVVGQGRRRRNRRTESITDIAFSEGQVLVSGLSNSDAPSTVRAITLPFDAVGNGAALEIFHGAHGRSENYAAIRTFVPLQIDGKPSLLAGYTCTPLVKVPLQDIAKANSIKGTTVAELGNRNRPLDMIHYAQDGNDYLLIANSARGVMKVSLAGVDKNEGITSRISGTAGQSYKTIEALAGVTQLDKRGDDQAVVIIKDGDSESLKTIALP